MRDWDLVELIKEGVEEEELRRERQYWVMERGSVGGGRGTCGRRVWKVLVRGQNPALE